MALVKMGEAAQQMGVSVDTVRRRLRRGELQGHHQPTPQGFIWLIEFPGQPGPGIGQETRAGSLRPAPADASAGQPSAKAAAHRDGSSSADLHALRELVDVLRHEIDTGDRHLDSKDRQIEQLHGLLQQAQSSAPSPGQKRTWNPGAPTPPAGLDV